MSVIRGDARHLPLADASVALIVTSPPYNARIKYDEYEDWLPWDEYWHGLIAPALRECYRVLVDGGRLCLNIGNFMPGNGWARFMLPVAMGILEEIGFLPREHISWIKGSDPEIQTDSGTAWGSWCSAQNPVLRAIAEPVLVVSKASYKRSGGISDLTRDEFLAWTRNVWSIPTEGSRNNQHPAPFPVELPRRLIKLYSYVGDTVLDPFLGRGTTLRAALITGRKGIGVELSHAYCRRAAGWLSQGMLPLPTPSPRPPPATQLALGEGG